ncbi:uncharacterized protein PHALS_07433 [Plasmopara halstedii]|uniref:Uncharacterized protein n=1 Tax=Plasmopara halstedii TaxID=4781 RepID=A0A0P1B4H0_PLAHL|nr:uncharacterized protein PHALS_07433 [Plasmopara halstedii]CEG49681.1 hypothetical protein PHALS_07433 [Plasmopara halstedii]|eukprot:XP_024586050.1 hypothetical protein PHALS_07433 [Plasmopara halstedii]
MALDPILEAVNITSFKKVSRSEQAVGIIHKAMENVKSHEVRRKTGCRIATIAPDEMDISLVGK